MTRRARAIATIVGAVAVAAAVHGGVTRAQSRPQQTPPYREGSDVPLDYRGPGRETPEPAVSDVALGWFGPGDPRHPDFGSAWRGAVLAIEEENAAGGYRPRRDGAAAVPFVLVPAWSELPWKAGVSDLLRLVYERELWAVVGGVDGTTTHLAVQLALKSRFLLLSPGSTDVTTDRANVPWLFSLAASDEAFASAFVGFLRQRPGSCTALLAATDHSSHATLASVRDAMARAGLGPQAIVYVEPAVEFDAAAAWSRLRGARCDVLVVLAPPALTGRLVRELRAAGYADTVVGGPSASSTAFVEAAGNAARGVRYPTSLRKGPRWDAFARAYARRWPLPPLGSDLKPVPGAPLTPSRVVADEPAAYAYDAVKAVTEAVRSAGLNRARIRDAVRSLEPYEGVGGTIRWNAQGRAERHVTLAQW